MRVPPAIIEKSAHLLNEVQVKFPQGYDVRILSLKTAEMAAVRAKRRGQHQSVSSVILGSGDTE